MPLVFAHLSKHRQSRLQHGLGDPVLAYPSLEDGFPESFQHLKGLAFFRPGQLPVPQDLLFDDVFLFQEVLVVQESRFFCCQISF